jgi:hypothetical protein
MLAENLQPFAAEVAKLVHKERLREAAQMVSDFAGLRLKIDTDNPAKTLPPLQNYLHYLLSANAMEQAAQLLWTPAQFTPEPQYTKDLWKMFDESNMGLIMGAASCSKSYGMGVRLFLEWIRDPEWTSVKVLGPSEDHLETNLFSHLVRLHESAKLPMPGEVGELFIGLDRRNQLSCIKGVVIPVGKVKKASRLQGNKRIPRPTHHPVFGDLSRMFIFIDEIENVPGGLWSDVDNILSQIQEEGPGGFKIFGAYNPTNQSDEVGKRAEPPFGWERFDTELHFRWKSARGWDVIRLDGEKSENVVQNKMVFPGLQTRAGLERVARNSGGRQSAGYFSMARGAYPPSGIELTVIPPGMLQKWRGEYIWYTEPKPCGACDLALEGGAAAAFALGTFGPATGMRLPPSVEFPKGQEIMFTDPQTSAVTPRMVLQVNQLFALAKGETVFMKNQLISLCRKSGIKPEYFCCDRTAHGQGVYDLMKWEWSGAVHGVNYSESATEMKIMQEDTQTAYDQYHLMYSELWFALRAWGEFGYMLIHPSVDMSKLTQQLTQRKFRPSGAKTKVESKKDYMSRGFSSPDEADALTLIVHAVRKGAGATPSMKGEGTGEVAEGDGWYDGGYEGGARIDPSNQTDILSMEDVR